MQLPAPPGIAVWRVGGCEPNKPLNNYYLLDAGALKYRIEESLQTSRRYILRFFRQFFPDNI
jgi:hypothetical protein